MDKISIIVPCYNEELSLPYFHDEINKIKKNIQKVKFEIIFVDDGSSDKTLDMLKKIRSKDKNVRYISFSRNFGKEAAMLAGLKASTGDYISIMDADLQDPPKLLIEMYKFIKTEEYDCITARRINRKGELRITSLFSNLYYKLINKLTSINLKSGIRDFRLMTRQMLNSILELTEYNRFSKGIFNWVGYNTKYIEYENITRKAGETKWGLKKLFLYAIESIVSFSNFPLFISFILGIIFFIIFLIIAIVMIKLLIIGNAISDLLIIAAIILLVSSINFFLTGIIGLYLSKTYLEVKKRPLYIIKETESDV